jgi:hypothetical protein
MEINRVLDPATRHAPDSEPFPKHKHKRKPRKTRNAPRSKKQLEQLASILDELEIPDITPTKVDMDDLELIDNLTQAQSELERLIDIEAEIVNNSKWNHDAAEALIALSSKAKRIPFGTRAELFDLRPTSTTDTKEQGTGQGSSKPSTKGKEREVDPPQRRSIYNLLPADAKDTWLRSSGIFWNPCILLRLHLHSPLRSPYGERQEFCHI